MKTDLELSHLEVIPGQSGRVSIDVINNADVIDGITAIVDGINPDWIRLERPLISLFPDASDRLELVLDIPTTCPAGDYLVIVRIVSTIDFERQTVHDFWLTVTPVPDLTVDLSPRIVTGGAVGTFSAIVTNTGNTNAEITVEALDPTREIDCTTDPTSLLLPQSDEAVVDVVLRGKRPWFGDPIVRTIDVTARVGDVEVAERATFRQKAKIPRGLLTALILAGIVLLWALIFLLVITQIRRTEPPAKVVGDGFVVGQESVPLVQVAASVGGLVTASTTGNGVPRITVEAFRFDPDPDPDPNGDGGGDGAFVLVGSAATDDDGRYSIRSLIPGTYKLRFVAEGFVSLWWPSAGDASTAEEIQLGPLDDPDDLDVEISGRNTGELRGQIAVPPDAFGTMLTIEATQQPERDDGTTGPGGLTEPIIATITPTQENPGNFVLTDLPTPATYEVQVTGPGFQTQQFEATLGGGQSTVLNTVQLGAAPGRISGLVSNGDGPFGGVTVTARSGDLSVTTVTPTSPANNVGVYEIIGLPTPRTYALTFEFPGYEPTTISLSLGPEEQATGNALMLGGNGTITGTAVGPGGAAVGGATVTVLGEGTTATTTTLTQSAQGGGPGSFTVEGLPVPGRFTVSITAPGFQTETLSAQVNGAAPQPVGTVTLVPSTAIVRGNVSSAAGGGLGEVDVTLSDGTVRQRITKSSTSPPGTYSFADVPPGTYTLTFERPPDFRTKVVLISVDAGVDVTQNVTLDLVP